MHLDGEAGAAAQIDTAAPEQLVNAPEHRTDGAMHLLAALWLHLDGGAGVAAQLHAAAPQHHGVAANICGRSHLRLDGLAAGHLQLQICNWECVISLGCCVVE